MAERVTYVQAMVTDQPQAWAWWIAFLARFGPGSGSVTSVRATSVDGEGPRG